MGLSLGTVLVTIVTFVNKLTGDLFFNVVNATLGVVRLGVIKFLLHCACVISDSKQQ